MAMIETTDHPAQETESTNGSERRRSRPLILVLIAVMALGLGAVGGWMLHGSEDDPAAFVAGGGELTQRQEEMLDMFYEYNDAVLANDGAAVVGMMTSSGTWSGDWTEARASDGSLEELVNNFPFTQLFIEPILVDGNKLLYAKVYRGVSGYDAVTFTTDGLTLKIVDHRWLA